MEEKIIPKMETKPDDLAGAISVNFGINEDFKAFCHEKLQIDGTKFDPLAMRVYIEDVFILTIYAKNNDFRIIGNEPVPVRKFKFKLDKDDFLRLFRQFDFTLLSHGFNLEQMQVIN